MNGVEVLQHEIGHLPFETEVSKVLRFGAENRLTVFCDNRLHPSTIPQGQVHRYKQFLHSNSNQHRIVQEYSFDFFNYAGIQRSVFLYTTPLIYIEDIALNTTLLNNIGVLDYNISISQPKSTSKNVFTNNEVFYLRLQLRNRKGALAAKAVSKKGDYFVGKLQIDKVNPWWPYLMNKTYGYLYTLEVYLHSANNDLLDVYRMKVGFRSLTWTNTSLFINGEPVYLRGFGRHEDSDVSFHILI